MSSSEREAAAPALRRRFIARLGAAAGATALAALLSASCVESAPAGPIMQLVPQGALAAVVVESPYKLFKASEEFWKSAGLDRSMGSDLQGFLEKTFPASRGGVDVLDFARPWALALLPARPSESAGTEAGGKKTRVLLYVPYRSSPDELLEKLFGGSSLAQVAKAKGYAVLSDDGDQLRFPPDKGAKLSRLTRYSSSSVKLWADPAAIRRAMGGDFGSIAGAARRFVADPAGAGRTDPASVARALGELGLSFLSQLELADASIEPGPAGLSLRVGASSAPGSELRGLLAGASRAPSALDWASQVDSKALLGASWSMGGSAGSELYRRLAESLFSAFGLPADVAAKASAFQAKWSAAGGPRGAMSLDLDIDAAALSELRDLKSREPRSDEGGAPSELFSKALRLRFELFREVKDKAAYGGFLRGLPADPDFLDLAKAYRELFGLSYSITARDLKEGSFPYGELGFKFGVEEEGKLGSLGDGRAEAALEALADRLTLRWSISQGRLAATNGDAAALKALATRKTAKESLAAQAPFAAFAKTMPPKPVFVGSFSMRRLMALAQSVAKAGSSSAALPLDSALLGSWYSYLAVDSRGGEPGLEAGFFIPASDIKALVGAGAGTLKRKNDPNGGV